MTEEEPYLPSLQFTTPPDTELEYLNEPTARDTIHTEILTTSLNQIASFQDAEPAPDSPECEPSQLKSIIISTAQTAVYTNPDIISASYPSTHLNTPVHPIIQQIQLPVIHIHQPMAHAQQPQAAAPQQPGCYTWTFGMSLSALWCLD